MSNYALPVLALVMLAFSWLTSLPPVYHDCFRLGAAVHRMMLPVSEAERFCIDNNKTIHFPGGYARG